MAICLDHWGDCNEDYHDGCEAPTKHRYYCDGDPRIEEDKKVVAPSVDIYREGAGVGPGRFDQSVFTRGLAARLPDLDQCYAGALKGHADLAGVVFYEFLLADDGHIGAFKAVRSALSAALDACVAAMVSNVAFDPGPEGGPVRYTYRFVFIPAFVPGEGE